MHAGEGRGRRGPDVSTRRNDAPAALDHDDPPPLWPMSRPSSTTQTSLPDPLDNLDGSSPLTSAAMPSSSPKQQAQQGSPTAGDRSRSASHDEGGGGRVKLESPFQEAGQGDAPALAGEESDAHGVGEDAEEEEVESAVKGRAQGGEQRAEPVEGQGGRDDAEAGRMRVNWAEERLEDEVTLSLSSFSPLSDRGLISVGSGRRAGRQIRPLDMHTAFTRPLLEYKAQQADVVQSASLVSSLSVSCSADRRPVRFCAGDRLRERHGGDAARVARCVSPAPGLVLARSPVADRALGEVWAFLYLRSLADSQAAVLETATARMAEEEIFQGARLSTARPVVRRLIPAAH